LEVVAPIVTVESLAGSSSEDSEMVHLTCDLELEVGDALGMSLSEVHAQYFQDSNEGKDSEVGRELVKECNYGDVILNHIRSGRYRTEDIDRVPYLSYREDT
jgi:hypothetical protein